MTQNNRLNTILNMLNTEPNDLFLNYSLGIEYLALENYALAIQQFNISLNLNNNYHTANYQLGKCYQAINDIDNAILNFKQGLEKAKQQKNNKAINEFNEAIFLIED